MGKWRVAFGALYAVQFAAITNGAEPTWTENQKRIIEIDREWADAEVNRDATVLRRILDDGFVAVSSSGEVADKETFIKRIVGDPTDKILSQDFEYVTVLVEGDTAFLVEINRLRGSDARGPYVQTLRITVTYAKRDGNWVALAEHFARATDLKADEAAIRKADSALLEAARQKQVDAWLLLYTDDAVVLPPHDKAANGGDSARKSINEFLALPELSISREPRTVSVARSGDLAFLTGAYSIAFRGTNGERLTDQGKQLEVWKKQRDGNWRCAADIWNSDLPVSPPLK